MRITKAIGFSFLILSCGFLTRAAFQRHSAPESVAAWRNIGGCGSSGGGAAAGAGKWVGRGVSGGLVDLELLSNHTVGGDYHYAAEALTSTFHYPKWPNYTAGVALAWKSNTYEYAGYKVSDDITPLMTREVGGMGDLGLQFNMLFGESNSSSLGLSASLPTGQHDIKRLHAKVGAGTTNEVDDIRWVNPFVQPGSGLYNLGVSYEYTKTKDWGLYVFGASYTSAWAWDNWGCRDDLAGATPNQKVYSCQQVGPSPITWKLWELQHQDWGADPKNWTDSKGAPGTGATGADGLSAYAYVGHKDESSTQSLGLTLSAPLSPIYYWEYGPAGGTGTGTDDNRISQRIRNNDYTLKVSAGMEITNPNFPVFLSIGVPYKLNDIMTRGRLVNPMNYVGTLGIRGTFF